ncbi:hypothetical protein [Paraburkholderia sp. EG304]|uniref:hypothetical protein n=1 Tax=Paraburkholderia sp. EG304 TaxID=3237015 RepID=UPI00397E3DAA
MAMPAMMKGYIDCVFSRDFAYETQPDGVHGLLSGQPCPRREPLRGTAGLVRGGRPMASDAAAAGYPCVPRIRFRPDRAPAFRRSRPGDASRHSRQHFAQVREFVRGHFASVQAA